RELALPTLYSNYDKIIRVRAYVQRFIDRLRHRTVNTEVTITAEEFLRAELKLIKDCQRSQFAQEFRTLMAEENVSRSSKLVNLNPFVDNQNLIRLRSRLSNSNKVEAFPIILSNNHNFYFA